MSSKREGNLGSVSVALNALESQDFPEYRVHLLKVSMAILPLLMLLFPFQEEGLVLSFCGGDCLDMWSAGQAMLPFRPWHQCSPLAAPLTACASCRRAEDLDHKPLSSKLSVSSVTVWKGQGSKFCHVEFWSECNLLRRMNG